MSWVCDDCVGIVVGGRTPLAHTAGRSTGLWARLRGILDQEVLGCPRLLGLVSRGRNLRSLKNSPRSFSKFRQPLGLRGIRVS